MQQIIKQTWHLAASIICVFLRLLYGILGMELTAQAAASFLQFAKFCIIGVSNTVVSYVVYTASLLLFQHLDMFQAYDYLAAQGIAFVLSVLWSYFWNSRTVFVARETGRKSVWKTLLKTYITYSVTGLFLNAALLYLWVQVLHISEFIAPLLNIPFSVPINFILNKCWAFKE